MKECLHHPREIRGVILQRADGGWYGQFHVAGGSLVVLAVSNCPFCGVPLWGRPGVAS